MHCHFLITLYAIIADVISSLKMLMAMRFCASLPPYADYAIDAEARFLPLSPILLYEMLQ